jgi:histidinol-phosphate/aromatic aminotransferase/cobyric acid decarboxylase-like protein
MNLNLIRNFQLNDIKLPITVSSKNENVNLNFIARLQEFSINHKYPDILSSYECLSNTIKIPKSRIIFGYGSDSLLKDLTVLLDYNTIEILQHSYEMGFFYNSLFQKQIFTTNWKYCSNFELANTLTNSSADVLYLVSPHCPTGITFKYEQIEEYCCHFKYVILDQAYTNPLEFDLRFLEINNLIILKTFSKLGGVPGLRLGYCVAQENIIQKLALVKNLYEISVSAAQYLKFITNNIHIINDNIKDLNCSVDNLKKKYSFVAYAGNFATVPDTCNLLGKRYIIDNQSFVRLTLPIKDY